MPRTVWISFTDRFWSIFWRKPIDVDFNPGWFCYRNAGPKRAPRFHYG